MSGPFDAVLREPMENLIRSFRDENDALRAEVARLTTEWDEAREQAAKFHSHSVTLNSVGYRISEALAAHKGSEQYLGQPIADVERLIARLKAAEAELARQEPVIAEIETWRWVLSPHDAQRALASIIASVDALAATQPTGDIDTTGGDHD